MWLIVLGKHETCVPAPPPRAFMHDPVIPQVFGVLDSPEYSGVTTGVYRPVIHDGKDDFAPGCSTLDPLHVFIPAALSSSPPGSMQVKPFRTRTKSTIFSMFLSLTHAFVKTFLQLLFSLISSVCDLVFVSSSQHFVIVQLAPAPGSSLEGPKWVSRWASLADSYADPGSSPPTTEGLDYFLDLVGKM